MPEAHDTVAAFRAAMQDRDRAALTRLVADDVVLRSPILSRRFTGHDEVLPLLEGVQETFHDLRFTADLAGSGWHGFAFEARVAGRDIAGFDLLRLDDRGRIAEFRVHVRPLVGVVAVARALGAHVAARRSRGRAALLRAAVAPQAALAAVTDRVGPWFVRP